ncbi:MAG: site-specific DNA-methyltransferase [Rhodospirillales bacterium]|nr:site-specific DNA-methyltransferase [Rhodospirillales bacterium]
MSTNNQRKKSDIAKQKSIVFDDLVIQSPKRTAAVQQGWHAFFPYYAGYPENFAREILKSARLNQTAVILDPWNGSGTTTFSASQLGLASQGIDLNPIMLIIARARLLPPSEADSIESLAREMLKTVRGDDKLVSDDDPLLGWFYRPTAIFIREIERRIRVHLIGDRTVTPGGPKLENISGLAATFYVALFSVCRHLTGRYRSTNPTWLRKPKRGENRITASHEKILSTLHANLKSMATTLSECDARKIEYGAVTLRVADSTKTVLPASSIDFVLTSPPYCTRIDYSAATRIELALLHPLLNLRMEDLGRKMIGSTRVPDHKIAIQPTWGNTCARFLEKLKAHPSKASDGYYLKTHLDYFDKMAAALANISGALKTQGAAVLVVQDSFYKEIHNDLPTMTIEMAANAGLRLRRRCDFPLKRSMSGINPHSRIYERPAGALEAVLCFDKT